MEMRGNGEVVEPYVSHPSPCYGSEYLLTSHIGLVINADRHTDRHYYKAARNGSSRRSYVLLLMFRLFRHEISELHRPIAAKLAKSKMK